MCEATKKTSERDMWSAALPKASLPKRTASSGGSDGLDDLLAEAAAAPAAATANKRKAAERKPAPRAASKARAPAAPNAPATEAETAAYEAIANLRLSLADAAATDRVNAALAIASDGGAFFAYFDTTE